jgi:hypothetical protein
VVSDVDSVTEADMSAARRWLVERGFTSAPTPILAARLANKSSTWAAGLFLLVALAEWVMRLLTQSFSHSPIFMIWLGLAALVAVGGWWDLRRRRALDERLGSLLVERAARVPRQGALRLLGYWFSAATMMTYVGGLVVGVVLAAVDRASADRWYTLGLAVTTILVAIPVAASFHDLLRRPALAENGEGLGIDDALRRADARAFFPYPLFVAWVGSNIVTVPVAKTTLTVYAGVGLLLTAAWMLPDHVQHQRNRKAADPEHAAADHPSNPVTPAS